MHINKLVSVRTFVHVETKGTVRSCLGLLMIRLEQQDFNRPTLNNIWAIFGYCTHTESVL